MASSDVNNDNTNAKGTNTVTETDANNESPQKESKNVSVNHDDDDDDDNNNKSNNDNNNQSNQTHQKTSNENVVMDGDDSQSLNKDKDDSKVHETSLPSLVKKKQPEKEISKTNENKNKKADDIAGDNNNDNEEEEKEGGNRKHKASSSSSPALSLPVRPIKRARTAYFIFTEEKRAQVQSKHVGEGVAAVAKILGQMWGSMSEEEKSVYQQKAAEERERVAKELEAWKAAGGDSQLLQGDAGGTAANANTTRDPNVLIYPMARIRKICKLDPEVRGMSKEAIMLITKCAELATAKLGTETVRVAQLQNRRKLLPEDVANVCAHREQFLFLKDDVKDLLRSNINNSGGSGAGTDHAKKSDAARDAAAAGSKPLTSYFGVTKKTSS